MGTILASIIGALAAGALAKLHDIGGEAVSNAYDALRTLIVSKLGGKAGAVQSVEDDPHSKKAQEALAEALANAGAAADPQLAEHAAGLGAKLSATANSGAPEATTGDIDVGNITAKVNVLIEDLVANGRIKLGDVMAQEGDATLRGLTAGAAELKKA